MQEIKIYVAASDAAGVIRDYANARTIAAPSLVRGIEACLKLRLFTGLDTMEAYPIENLQAVTAWEWVMDKDFDSETAFILVADNANITATTVTEVVDETEYNYTEISIPLPNTNTEELNAWLGTNKSKNGLTAELVGYDAEGSAVFVLQLENFTVRNRLTGSGEPTAIEPEYLTEAQVRALIAGDFRNPLELQFSVDGVSDWHEAQTADDRYFRQRIANLDAEWSDAVMMAQGVAGHSPERGVDYWTDADKAEIKSYVDEQILNGEW